MLVYLFVWLFFDVYRVEEVNIFFNVEDGEIFRVYMSNIFSLYIWGWLIVL